MQATLSVLAAALLALPGAASALEALKPNASVAFLGIHFIDTSTEGSLNGAREDETARLALLEDEVRDRFAAEGFDLLDTAPVEEELSRVRDPANCNNCDLKFAGELGADYALVGQVQKVSNLILSMNLALRDVATGEYVRLQAVDIRGNTDESWLRGGDYILDNHVFAGG